MIYLLPCNLRVAVKELRVSGFKLLKYLIDKLFHLFWHLWLIFVIVDNLTPTFTLKTYSVFLAIHCSRLISLTFPWRNPVIQEVWFHQYPQTFFSYLYVDILAALDRNPIHISLYPSESCPLTKAILIKSSLWQFGWIFWIYFSEFIWNLDHILLYHSMCSYSLFCTLEHRIGKVGPGVHCQA